MNLNAFTPGVLIYTLYLFLLLLTTLGRYNKSNKENLPVFIFFVVLQIFMCGLRSYTVGSDTGSYVYQIRYLSDFSTSEILSNPNINEPFFYIFTKFITEINHSYTFLFFVMGLLWWIFVAGALYRNSKSCLISLVILELFKSNYLMWSGMRQGMAMAIILASFKYLESRKMVKCMGVVFLASLFHESALLFIPVYFIHNLKLNKPKWMIGLLAVSLVAAFILPDVDIGGESMTYSNYIQADGMGNYYSFIVGVLAFAFIVYSVAIVGLNDRNNLLFTLSMFAMMTTLMGMNISIAYRISDYFRLFMALLIANLVMERKAKKNTVIIISLVVLLIFILTGMPVDLDNYQFFWETNFMDYEYRMLH